MSEKRLLPSARCPAEPFTPGQSRGLLSLRRALLPPLSSEGYVSLTLRLSLFWISCV